jgi:hypothetical protein
MLAGVGRFSEAARFVSLIRNERIKLTALWLNTLSGVSIAAAVIARCAFTACRPSLLPRTTKPQIKKAFFELLSDAQKRAIAEW